MNYLPKKITTVLQPFEPVFTQPSWKTACVLLMGALLCQGTRRISSILRVMGLAQQCRFEKYHRFFNRARWNSLALAKILLGWLVAMLPKEFPILMVVDDTVERRKGKAIRAKGCYRDACRSTEKNVVTCFGLKWLCMMLIVPLPFAKRPWALPVMTVLAPSKEANKSLGRTHRTCIDWSITLTRVLSRWLKRSWVFIGDGAFACVRLGHCCIKNNVTLISRLRLDVALYEFPDVPNDKKGRGRPRQKGKRTPSLNVLAQDESQAWKLAEVNWYGGKTKAIKLITGISLWCTSGEKPLPIRWVLTRDVAQPDKPAAAFFSSDLNLAPEKIIEWFVLRWNIEVTFEEVRAHLGFETQRQWSDKAIARTTPVLMGLFSLVCLLGLEMMKTKALPVLSTAWYKKGNMATFSDILTFIRRSIWHKRIFDESQFSVDYPKNNRDWQEDLINQLAAVT